MKNNTLNPISISKLTWRLIGLFGLTLFTCASNLQAEDKTDGAWIARINVALDQPGSTTLTTQFSGLSDSADVSFGSGFMFGGSVGYAWDNGFLLEVDYNWKSGGADRAPDFLFGPNTDVEVSSVVIAPSLWYRLEIEEWPTLKPKLGLSYGWLQEVSFDAEAGGSEESFDGDGTAFSVMAGLDWNIQDNWILGVELRYYDGGNIDAVSEVDPSRSVSFDYSGWNAGVSVGYKF